MNGLLCWLQQGQQPAWLASGPSGADPALPTAAGGPAVPERGHVRGAAIQDHCALGQAAGSRGGEGVLRSAHDRIQSQN